MKRLAMLIAATAAALLLAAPAGAAVKKVTYRGKTAEGQTIAFKVSKNGYVWNPRTNVTMTCEASEQGIVSEPSLDPFLPFFGFPIGQSSKATDEGPTIPYRYEFSAYRAGKAIKGSLSQSYSGVAPDNQGGVRAVTCSGSTTYLARPAS